MCIAIVNSYLLDQPVYRKVNVKNLLKGNLILQYLRFTASKGYYMSDIMNDGKDRNVNTWHKIEIFKNIILGHYVSRSKNPNHVMIT